MDDTREKPDRQKERRQRRLLWSAVIAAVAANVMLAGLVLLLSHWWISFESTIDVRLVDEAGQPIAVERGVIVQVRPDHQGLLAPYGVPVGELPETSESGVLHGVILDSFSGLHFRWSDPKPAHIRFAAFFKPGAVTRAAYLGVVLRPLSGDHEAYVVEQTAELGSLFRSHGQTVPRNMPVEQLVRDVDPAGVVSADLKAPTGWGWTGTVTIELTAEQERVLLGETGSSQRY